MIQKQVSCDKGHYYIKSLGECPICNENSNQGTVLLNINDEKNSNVESGSNNVKTLYIRSAEEEKKETVSEVVLAGWLIIISEKGKGESYPITFGFNSIGRGEDNHICINNQDNSISREKHASVIYDYSNNIYFLKHESGKFLTYLNNNLVLETKELTSFDTIKIGNTKLLFVALCGENFKWDSTE